MITREDALVARDLVFSAFVLLLVPVIVVWAVLDGAWGAVKNRWPR